MPKEIDIERFERFKKDLDLLKLRFPVATLSKRLEVDRGNLSRMLSGRKPISEAVLQRFYEVYGEEIAARHEGEALSHDGKVLSVVKEEPVSYRTYGDVSFAEREAEVVRLRKENQQLLRRINDHLLQVRDALEVLGSRQMVTERLLKGLSGDGGKKMSRGNKKEAEGPVTGKKKPRRKSRGS